MKKNKKILCLLMILVLTASLISCKADDAEEGNVEDQKEVGQNESEDTTDTSEIDTSEFVTINMHVLGDPPTTGQVEVVQEKWNELLEKKVNAHMELQWIEWADYMTKYNLLLASGEEVDLINIASDWLELWPNAQKGAFKELDDLLPIYAPKTYAEISEEDWEQCKYNGKIVCIPENDFTQWVDHGIYYRGDWAEEFGIKEPITDWETLGEYFQGIKDNKPDVIPWDVVGTKNEVIDQGWFVTATDSIPLDIPTGFARLFWSKSYDEKYNVYSPYFEDTFVEFAKLMKEWADKGYWREDVLNYDGDTREALLAGKTGADQHHTQTFSTLRTKMDEEQPGSDLQMFAFCDTRDNLISMPITHGGISIGAKSKNPERALMVYELIRQDEEFYRLLNYGIEGVHYVIEDERRVRPDGYDDTTDEYYSNFWGGRVDKFEVPSEEVWDGVFEIYENKEKIAKPYPYGRFVFDKENIEAELAALSDVTNKMLPAIAWGKVDDPIGAVEDFREKLKAAGYEKALDEIQRQMDDYEKLVEDN